MGIDGKRRLQKRKAIQDWGESLPDNLPKTLMSSMPEWIFNVILRNGGATSYCTP